MPYDNPFATDAELAKLYDQERRNSADDSVFTGALKSGLYGLGSTTNAAAAAIARSIGLDTLAANRERSAVQWDAEAQGAGYKTPSLQDVTGLDSAADWAAGMVGSNVPLLGSLIGGSTLGALGGALARGKKGLAKGIANEERRRAVELYGDPGVADTFAKQAETAALGRMSASPLPEAIHQALYGGTRAARVGRSVGAVTPYFLTSAGEDYNSLINDPNAEGTPAEMGRAALLTGAGQAALGTMLDPMGLMQRIVKHGRKAREAAAMGGKFEGTTPFQDVGLAMLDEGGTEAGEQLIQQYMRNQFNPAVGYDPMELVEAGLGGALVGGVYSTPSALIERMRASQSQVEQPEPGKLPEGADPRDPFNMLQRIRASASLYPEGADDPQFRYDQAGAVAQYAAKTIELKDGVAAVGAYREVRDLANKYDQIPVPPDGTRERGQWFGRRAELARARIELEKSGLISEDQIKSGAAPILNTQTSHSFSSPAAEQAPSPVEHRLDPVEAPPSFVVPPINQETASFSRELADAHGITNFILEKAAAGKSPQEITAELGKVVESRNDPDLNATWAAHPSDLQKAGFVAEVLASEKAEELPPALGAEQIPVEQGVRPLSEENPEIQELATKAGIPAENVSEMRDVLAKKDAPPTADQVAATKAGLVEVGIPEENAQEMLDLILTRKGKPFASEKTARTAMRERGIEGELVSKDDNFYVRRPQPSAEEVSKAAVQTGIDQEVLQKIVDDVQTMEQEPARTSLYRPPNEAELSVMPQATEAAHVNGLTLLLKDPSAKEGSAVGIVNAKGEPVNLLSEEIPAELYKPIQRLQYAKTPEQRVEARKAFDEVLASMQQNQPAAPEVQQPVAPVDMTSWVRELNPRSFVLPKEEAKASGAKWVIATPLENDTKSFASNLAGKAKENGRLLAGETFSQVQPGDIVYVSVPGASRKGFSFDKSTYAQDAQKALEAGAVLRTDNEVHATRSHNITGEGQLRNFLKSQGYVETPNNLYSEWRKPGVAQAPTRPANENVQTIPSDVLGARIKELSTNPNPTEQEAEVLEDYSTEAKRRGDIGARANDVGYDETGLPPVEWADLETPAFLEGYEPVGLHEDTWRPENDEEDRLLQERLYGLEYRIADLQEKLGNNVISEEEEEELARLQAQLPSKPEFVQEDYFANYPGQHQPSVLGPEITAIMGNQLAEDPEIKNRVAGTLPTGQRFINSVLAKKLAGDKKALTKYVEQEFGTTLKDLGIKPEALVNVIVKDGSQGEVRRFFHDIDRVRSQNIHMTSKLSERQNKDLAAAVDAVALNHVLTKEQKVALGLERPDRANAILSRVEVPLTLNPEQGYDMFEVGNGYTTLVSPSTRYTLRFPTDFLNGLYKNLPFFVNGKKVPTGSIAEIVLQAIEHGASINADTLMKAAVHSYEHRTEPKTRLVVSAEYDPFSKETIFKEVNGEPWEIEDVESRPSPFQKKYGITSAKLHVRGEEAYKPAFAALVGKMLSTGVDADGPKVLVGKMDNNLYFATPEKAWELYNDWGTVKSIGEDLNILERMGVLLKKQSGDYDKLSLDLFVDQVDKVKEQVEREINKLREISFTAITNKINSRAYPSEEAKAAELQKELEIAEKKFKAQGLGEKMLKEAVDKSAFFHDSNTHDGLMVRMPGARLCQAVSVQEVINPETGKTELHLDKGMVRSLLSDMLYDIDENGHYKRKGTGATENASLNKELQLKKWRDPLALVKGAFLTINRMFPPASPRGGRANLQQAIFSLINPIGFLRRDRENRFTDTEIEEHFADPGSKDLFDIGVPAPFLVSPRDFLRQPTQVASNAVQAYTLSSELVRDDDVMPDGRHRGYVKLLPRSFNEINELWRKEHNGKNIKKGDILLINRNPALSDGSAMAEYIFDGVMELSERDVSRGIVVHPNNRMWKEAAGDFDGDAGVVIVPDELMQARPTRQETKLSFVKKKGFTAEPHDLGDELLGKWRDIAEGKLTGEARAKAILEDDLSNAAIDRANGFSDMIGQIMGLAQRVKEFGLAENRITVNDPETGDPISITFEELLAKIGQASISAKKKATWRDEALAALKAVKNEVKKLSPRKVHPIYGYPIEIEDTKYGPYASRDSAFTSDFRAVNRAPTKAKKGSDEPTKADMQAEEVAHATRVIQQYLYSHWSLLSTPRYAERWNVVRADIIKAMRDVVADKKVSNEALLKVYSYNPRARMLEALNDLLVKGKGKVSAKDIADFEKAAPEPFDFSPKTEAEARAALGARVNKFTNLTLLNNWFSFSQNKLVGTPMSVVKLVSDMVKENPRYSPAAPEYAKWRILNGRNDPINTRPISIELALRALSINDLYERAGAFDADTSYPFVFKQAAKATGEGEIGSTQAMNDSRKLGELSMLLADTDPDEDPEYFEALQKERSKLRLKIKLSVLSGDVSRAALMLNGPQKMLADVLSYGDFQNMLNALETRTDYPIQMPIVAMHNGKEVDPSTVPRGVYSYNSDTDTFYQVGELDPNWYETEDGEKKYRFKNVAILGDYSLKRWTLPSAAAESDVVRSDIPRFIRPRMNMFLVAEHDPNSKRMFSFRALNQEEHDAFENGTWTQSDVAPEAGAHGEEKPAKAKKVDRTIEASTATGEFIRAKRLRDGEELEHVSISNLDKKGLAGENDRDILHLQPGETVDFRNGKKGGEIIHMRVAPGLGRPEGVKIMLAPSIDNELTSLENGVVNVNMAAINNGETFAELLNSPRQVAALQAAGLTKKALLSVLYNPELRRNFLIKREFSVIRHGQDPSGAYTRLNMQEALTAPQKYALSTKENWLFTGNEPVYVKDVGKLRKLFVRLERDTSRDTLVPPGAMGNEVSAYPQSGDQPRPSEEGNTKFWLDRLNDQPTREKMQKVVDSFRLSHSIAGSPKLINAQTMYDMLKDSSLDSDKEMADKILAYAGDATKGVRGVYYKNQDTGEVFIYVAKQGTQGGQAATLAHEMGHWIIDSELQKLRSNNFATFQWVLGDFYKKFYDKKHKVKTEKVNDLWPEDLVGKKEFHEWLADNIATYILKNKTVASASGTWFRAAARQFIKAFATLRDILKNTFTLYRTPAVLHSVEAWLKDLSMTDSQIELIYGSENKKLALIDVVEKRRTAMKEWATTGVASFEALNGIVELVAFNLDNLVSYEDAMMLRRVAFEPIFQQRMFTLVGKDSRAARLISEKPEYAAAYLVALATGNILKVSGRTDTLVNRLSDAARLKNRMTVESLPAETDEILGALAGRDVIVPNKEPLLSTESPAHRLYAERGERHAKGVIGAAMKLSSGYQWIAGAYIDAPHQRILNLNNPVLTWGSNEIQPAPYEIGHYLAAGSEERSNAGYQIYAQELGAALKGLSIEEQQQLSDVMHNVKSVTASEAVLKARDRIRLVLNDLHEYETQWLAVGYRKDYWPMILNLPHIKDNMDDTVAAFTATPEFEDGWKEVKKQYKVWITKALANGRGINENEELELEESLKELDDMLIPDFVRMYLERNEERLLPGNKIVQLEAGKVHTPSFRSMNPRLLNFLLQTNQDTAEGQAIHSAVVDKLVNQPGEVLQGYVKNSAKRTEFARLMWRLDPEKGKLSNFLNKAEQYGATPEHKQLFVDYIDAVTGTLGITERDHLDSFIDKFGPDSVMQGLHSHGNKMMNEKLRTAYSWLMAWLNVSHLTLSAASSSVDIFGSNVRKGDWSNFMSSLRETRKLMQDMAKTPEGLSILQKQIIAVGTLEHRHTVKDLAATYYFSGMTPGPQWLMGKWFKYNGVEWITDMARGKATIDAFIYIKDMVKQVEKGGEEELTARKRLAELGLVPEDVKFNPEDQGGDVHIMMNFAERAAASAEEKERDLRVRVAIHRFVDTSSARPDPTNRPIYTSNPYYAPVSMWTGFITNFDNNILRPAYARAVEDHDYMPIAIMLSMFVPTMFFADLLRDVVKTALDGDDDDFRPAWKKDWTMSDHIIYAVERAGIYGRHEKVLDVVQPLLEGKVADAAASLGSVATSDLNKAIKWGAESLPYPGKDAISSWR